MSWIRYYEWCCIHMWQHPCSFRHCSSSTTVSLFEVLESINETDVITMLMRFMWMSYRCVRVIIAPVSLTYQTENTYAYVVEGGSPYRGDADGYLPAWTRRIRDGDSHSAHDSLGGGDGVARGLATPRGGQTQHGWCWWQDQSVAGAGIGCVWIKGGWRERRT